MKSLMNNADLYRIPAAKSTVVLIRREQQILCQCVWDWMGSVEEWLPVCHHGLDFLDKLTLHNPQSLRCVDCHFWDVVFTQMLLARTEDKINISTTGKCIKYVADSLFASRMTIKLIFRNIWHSVYQKFREVFLIRHRTLLYLFLHPVRCLLHSLLLF